LLQALELKCGRVAQLLERYADSRRPASTMLPTILS
jgi:hypothetical protein